MKRTKAVVAAAFLVLAVGPGPVRLAGQEPAKPQEPARAQEPAVPAPAPAAPAKDAVATDPAVAAAIARMRETEAGFRTMRLELQTSGAYPGGPSFTTKGTLRVLRTEQSALHAVVEFAFDDGLKGRMETVRTPEGVLMLEDTPTFGPVFLSMDPALVADVVWASKLLDKGAGLPGVEDDRAQSPLGSSMLADLARLHDLRVLSSTPRKGTEGRWVGGDVRGGLTPEQVGDLPLADRVEVFLRSPDDAMLEVVYLQAGKPIQRIEVLELEVDRPMELSSFRIDAGDRKPKDVKLHQPSWGPLERLLREADAKAEEQKLPPRPSRR